MELLCYLFNESYLYLTFIVSITTLDVTKVNLLLFKLSICYTSAYFIFILLLEHLTLCTI